MAARKKAARDIRLVFDQLSDDVLLIGDSRWKSRAGSTDDPTLGREGKWPPAVCSMVVQGIASAASGMAEGGTANPLDHRNKPNARLGKGNGRYISINGLRSRL